MKLQKANITDLNEIILWISNEQACMMWAGPHVSFPLTIEKFSKEIVFSADNSFCYKKDESIFAFGQLLTKEKGCLHLARIIVNPIRRGKGYGRLLCTELVDLATQKDCQKISLNVYRSNVSAIKLYLKLGFREVQEKSSKEIQYMVKT